MLPVPNSCRARWVKPTGMVDLIRMRAPGLACMAWRITPSTELVSK